MTAAYLFIGFFATVVGALPPGASNMAVIKTTINHDIKESLKITYGAGIGEMLLAIIALTSGMVVQEFFTMHIWVQYLAAVILTLVGIYFMFLKKERSSQKRPLAKSKYLLGFTLSVINPPVLVYWVLIFSLLNHFIGNTFLSSNIAILLFLGGVFLGKCITLYGYSKLGLYVQKKKSTEESQLNRVIGLILLCLGIIQFIKLLITT